MRVRDVQKMGNIAMQIPCPNCGQTIQSQDMNLDNMVAKCRSCHALLNLPSRIVASAAPITSKSAAPLRPKHSKPPRFEVEEDESAHTFRIAYRWLNAGFIFLCFFTLSWLIFTAVMWTFAILILFKIEHPASKFFPLILCIPTFIGIFLVYMAAAGLVNRTEIMVSPDGLRVNNGPLPWYGNIQYDVLDIAQFYCVEQIQHSRHHVHYRYHLNALTKDGKKLPVLRHLNEKDHALFIEQELERFLAIEDQPVKGEVSG